MRTPLVLDATEDDPERPPEEEERSRDEERTLDDIIDAYARR